MNKSIIIKGFIDYIKAHYTHIEFNEYDLYWFRVKDDLNQATWDMTIDNDNLVVVRVNGYFHAVARYEYHNNIHSPEQKAIPLSDPLCFEKMKEWMT
jgi:hypothetical protein